MATTFYDDNTGYFVRKIKTLTGKYRKIKIGKPTPGSDPNIIPPDILDMGERWQDEHIVIQPAKVESAATLKVESAATVFGPQPTRPIYIYKYLEAYYRQQSKELRPLSLRKLRWVIDHFTAWCRKQGLRYLHEVRGSTVKAYLYDESNAHLAPQTQNNYLSMLGKCWSEAIELEQYRKRPVNYIFKVDRQVGGMGRCDPSPREPTSWPSPAETSTGPRSSPTSTGPA